jgi:hypothetical protein
MKGESHIEAQVSLVSDDCAAGTDLDKAGETDVEGGEATSFSPSALSASTL